MLMTSSTSRLRRPQTIMQGLGVFCLFAVSVCLAVSAQAQVIDVFLIGGQSNADGHADPAGLPSELSGVQNNVLFYWKNPRAESGGLVSLQPGTSETYQFGPEVTFGRDMADYLAPQGHQVALLKFADGGTNLYVQWKADGTLGRTNDGTLYQTFQDWIDAGLTELNSTYPTAQINIRGMIWMQGESDCNATYSAAYEENLARFIADVRLNYGENLPFIIGQLSTDQTKFNATYLAAVQAAQASVADADPYAELVVTTGFGLNPDFAHFNTQGMMDLGSAFASAMQTQLVPEPAACSLLLMAGVGLLSIRRKR